MNFTIQSQWLRDSRTPLFCQYDRQIRPQDAYVQIDNDGTVSASYNSEIGDSLPPSVYFGIDIRIPCSSGVDGDALATYMESPEFIAGLERIKAGHVIEQYNRRGALTDDAQAALNEIEQALQALKQWDVWTLDTYLDNSDTAFDDVTMAGSVEKLVAIWRRAIDQSLDEGIHVFCDDDDLRSNLLKRYGALIQEAAELGLYPDKTQRAAEIIGYEIQFDED